MLKKIENYMTQMLGDSGSHDIDHTLRVRDLCLKIGKIEGADLEILHISALLHDIGRPKEFETKGQICHAQYGAELSSKFLKGIGLEPQKIDRVVQCIRVHRYRNGLNPETLEEKILYDADKLDCIGAVGIGRAFMCASEIGSKLHNDKGIDIETVGEYTRDDTAYREYMVKLRHIKDKMHTQTAKKMAEKRHKLMELFFENLLTETRGL